MEINIVTCERCGKHQSVNSTIRFNIHVPPYAYYGYNICRNCYKKYKEFMDELGRTELWTDSREVKDEKGEWIPVSKKLPDVPQRYLVYTKEDDVITDLFMENGKFMLGDDIIAWQPLPEPYRKGDKNEH